MSITRRQNKRADNFCIYHNFASSAVQHTITGSKAGIIAGSILVTIGIVTGIIEFIVYKRVQKHRRYNAAPMLELSDLESNSSSSSGKLFISNSRTSSSEIVLGGVSVESDSRSSNPSP